MPNFENIQHEPLRRLIDPKYLDLVSKLEDCFYGDQDSSGKRSRENCWLDGSSRPFEMGGVIYDVQNTVEESRELFNKIHSAIWKQYEIEFIEENEKQILPSDRLSENEKEVALRKGYFLENGQKVICKINPESLGDKEEKKKELEKLEISAVRVPRISLKKWEEFQKGVK